MEIPPIGVGLGSINVNVGAPQINNPAVTPKPVMPQPEAVPVNPQGVSPNAPPATTIIKEARANLLDVLNEMKLPPTQQNFQAAQSLMTYQQPVNPQTIQLVRKAMVGLPDQSPQTSDAVVVLLANRLPATPDNVAAVRQLLTGQPLTQQVRELEAAIARLQHQIGQVVPQAVQQAVGQVVVRQTLAETRDPERPEEGDDVPQERSQGAKGQGGAGQVSQTAAGGLRLQLRQFSLPGTPPPEVPNLPTPEADAPPPPRTGTATTGQPVQVAAQKAPIAVPADAALPEGMEQPTVEGEAPEVPIPGSKPQPTMAGVSAPALPSSQPLRVLAETLLASAEPSLVDHLPEPETQSPLVPESPDSPGPQASKPQAGQVPSSLPQAKGPILPQPALPAPTASGVPKGPAPVQSTVSLPSAASSPAPSVVVADAPDLLASQTAATPPTVSQAAAPAAPVTSAAPQAALPAASAAPASPQAALHTQPTISTSPHQPVPSTPAIVPSNSAAPPPAASVPLPAVPQMAAPTANPVPKGPASVAAAVAAELPEIVPPAGPTPVGLPATLKVPAGAPVPSTPTPQMAPAAAIPPNGRPADAPPVAVSVGETPDTPVPQSAQLGQPARAAVPASAQPPAGQPLPPAATVAKTPVSDMNVRQETVRPQFEVGPHPQAAGGMPSNPVMVPPGTQPMAPMPMAERLQQVKALLNAVVQAQTVKDPAELPKQVPVVEGLLGVLEEELVLLQQDLQTLLPHFPRPGVMPGKETVEQLFKLIFGMKAEQAAQGQTSQQLEQVVRHVVQIKEQVQQVAKQASQIQQHLTGRELMAQPTFCLPLQVGPQAQGLASEIMVYPDREGDGREQSGPLQLVLGIETHHMGKVTIDLTTHQRELVVALKTTSPEVKAKVDAKLAQLNERLKDLPYEIKGLNCLVVPFDPPTTLLLPPRTNKWSLRRIEGIV